MRSRVDYELALSGRDAAWARRARCAGLPAAPRGGAGRSQPAPAGRGRGQASSFCPGSP